MTSYVLSDELAVVIEKAYVSYDKALSKLDELLLAYEDNLLEAGIRLVNGRWQIWVKISDNN